MGKSLMLVLVTIISLFPLFALSEVNRTSSYGYLTPEITSVEFTYAVSGYYIEFCGKNLGYQEIPDYVIDLWEVFNGNEAWRKCRHARVHVEGCVRCIPSITSTSSGSKVRVTKTVKKNNVETQIYEHIYTPPSPWYYQGSNASPWLQAWFGSPPIHQHANQKRENRWKDVWSRGGMNTAIRSIQTTPDFFGVDPAGNNQFIALYYNSYNKLDIIWDDQGGKTIRPYLSSSRYAVPNSEFIIAAFYGVAGSSWIDVTLKCVSLYKANAKPYLLHASSLVDYDPAPNHVKYLVLFYATGTMSIIQDGHSISLQDPRDSDFPAIQYYNIHQDNLALTGKVEGAFDASHPRIYLAIPDSSHNQQWEILPVEGDYVLLLNRATRKVIDANAYQSNQNPSYRFPFLWDMVYFVASNHYWRLQQVVSNTNTYLIISQSEQKAIDGNYGAAPQPDYFRPSPFLWKIVPTAPNHQWKFVPVV